jgi:hypothetical protein
LVGASRVQCHCVMAQRPPHRTLLVEKRVRPHSLAPSFRYLTRARRRGARLYSGLRQSFRGTHSHGDKQSVTMLLTAKIGAPPCHTSARNEKSLPSCDESDFRRAGRSQLVKDQPAPRRSRVAKTLAPRSKLKVRNARVVVGTWRRCVRGIHGALISRRWEAAGFRGGTSGIRGHPRLGMLR